MAVPLAESRDETVVPADADGLYRIGFGAMASCCEICLPAADAASAQARAAPAIAEVRRIERKYSRYRDDSVVAGINAAAGRDWVDLDEETAALLNYADVLFRQSGGLFDITSGVLRRAWDFKRGIVPDDATLAGLRPLIGWERVERIGIGCPAGTDSTREHAGPATQGERGPARLRLPRTGMEIDLGGFGKEYAVDRAAAALSAAGVTSGYVNLGGDMRILGPRPDGAPWSIGIQAPRRADATVAAIPIASGALATSGDYERYFERDGRRYCHILDPRDGRPVQAWQSVSVLAPLAIVAGSHSTIAMLMGDGALDFLRGSGLAWLAIDGDGRLHRHDVPAAGADRPRA